MNTDSYPPLKPSTGLQRFVGLTAVHWKTKKLYRIQAIVWDGVADTWAILHAEVLASGEVHDVSIVRTIDNFTAEVSPGVPRYDITTFGGYCRAVAVLGAIESSLKDSTS